MNKRIKELAEQAAAVKGWGPEVWNSTFTEELARLLIKETMSIVEKNISWNGYLDAVEAVHTQLGVDRSIN